MKLSRNGQIVLSALFVASLVLGGAGFAQAKATQIAYQEQTKQIKLYKDELNEEPYCINDIYYIYTTNKLAKIIVKYLQHKIQKVFDLGYIWDYDNKAVWMAEYNGMIYDTPPSTSEEIAAECSDIREKQKTEYKRQYDRLIKFCAD